jgi:tetratricopeptide (TPR) repeat protein
MTLFGFEHRWPIFASCCVYLLSIIGFRYISMPRKAAMSQTPTISLEQARAELRKAEANRSDPRRRGLFWNAKTWEETFKKITASEYDRDHDIQLQIDQARKTRQIDRILSQLQRYYEYIDSDAAWYKAREEEMRELRERWETYQVADASAITQLTSHYGQIVYRLRERRVVLGQIAIEILEEQRRQGRTPRNWPDYWERLRVAFREQDSAYRQAFTPNIPLSFYSERLRWCEKLRSHQRSTALRLGALRNLDRAELAKATALVDKLINELQPPPSRIDWGAIAGIGAVVIIVLIAFLALRNPRTGSSNTLQPTDRPAPAFAGPALRETPVLGATAPSSTPVNLQSLNQQALELLKQKRYQEAHDLFQQAAAASPGSYEPRNNMAFCLYELGQNDQAIEQWRQALALSEQNSPDANAGLGMALYASGRQDEGFRYYQRASALNQDYRDENLLRTRYYWGDKAIADSRPLREQLTR